MFSSYFIEKTSGAAGSVHPDIPTFEIERYKSAKIQWKPNYAGASGTHFFVKYRKKGDLDFKKTDPQINDDTIIVGSLETNKEYEFKVVSVDGKYETESASKIFLLEDDEISKDTIETKKETLFRRLFCRTEL